MLMVRELVGIITREDDNKEDDPPPPTAPVDLRFGDERFAAARELVGDRPRLGDPEPILRAAAGDDELVGDNG